MVIALKFCERECLVVNHVSHLFMAEIRWVVLKRRMSQVTDVAEKEIQESMADQVTMMEPELRLCVFV